MDVKEWVEWSDAWLWGLEFEDDEWLNGDNLQLSHLYVGE